MPDKHSVTYFCLFRGIHDVLKAETVLKSQGVSFELVPVPRALSSDCGVCIALQNTSGTIVSLLLSLNIDRCFSFNGRAYTPVNVDTLDNHATEQEVKE